MCAASSDLLTIGEVAAIADVAASTLRYYERVGLLPPPGRQSGRRRYDPTVIQRLAVIDVAKRAGFTLDEIRDLLADFDAALPSSERWREMAARKLPEVQALLHDVERMRRLLTDGMWSVRLAGRPWGYPSPFAPPRGPLRAMSSLLFDTLLWKYPSGVTQPWLAHSMEASPDGLQRRFVLHDNARFHDGQPLTAHDVVFTFGYLQERAGTAAAHDVADPGALSAIETVHADARHAVRFRLSRPYAAFDELVAGRVPVLPAHVWAEVADPLALRGPEAVLGSGPFVFESGDGDRGHYRYRANERFFLGPPQLRQVEFTPVDDQLVALDQGLIDAVVLVSDSGRPTAEQLAELHASPRHVVRRRPGEWTRALHFDLRPGSPFADRRVRQALAHGIDRDAMVRRLLDGLGKPASLGGLAPTHPLAASGLAPHGIDRTRAGALLDAAGLTRPPGAGTRLHRAGPWRPKVLTEEADPGAAELVRDDLQRLGVDAEVVRLPRQDCDAALTTGRYELALAGYGGLGSDPDVLRLRLSARVAAANRTRVHGYDSPQFEALAEEQSVACDPKRRAVLVGELQQLIATDLPTLPLYVPDQLTISPAKQIFTAWHPTPGGVWAGGPLNKATFVTGGPR
ncbi:MAG: ABC transporter substrate-binding protein [Egibacteraceae bacterium]